MNRCLLLALAFFTPTLAGASQYDQRMEAYQADARARYIAEANAKLFADAYKSNAEHLAAFRQVISRRGYTSCTGECWITPFECREGGACERGRGWVASSSSRVPYESLAANGSYYISSCKLDFADGFSCNVGVNFREEKEGAYTADCVNDARVRDVQNFVVGRASRQAPAKARRHRL